MGTAAVGRVGERARAHFARTLGAPRRAPEERSGQPDGLIGRINVRGSGAVPRRAHNPQDRRSNRLPATDRSSGPTPGKRRTSFCAQHRSREASGDRPALERAEPCPVAGTVETRDEAVARATPRTEPPEVPRVLGSSPGKAEGIVGGVPPTPSGNASISSATAACEAAGRSWQLHGQRLAPTARGIRRKMRLLRKRG